MHALGRSSRVVGVLSVVLLLGFTIKPCWSQDDDKEAEKAKKWAKHLAELKAVNDGFDAVFKQTAPSPAEKATTLADWMSSNDWEKLGLYKRVMLMEGLAPRGDSSRELAVRWSGFLTAPSNGTYRLEQLRNEYFAGNLRVWLSDQLVLDSATSDQSNDDSRFRSQPVALVADQAVPLRVEFVRNPAASRAFHGDVAKSHPIAALLWESEQVNKQLITSDAYSPPNNFGEGNGKGLKGEYFGGRSFEQPLFTRLDAGVGLSTHEELSADHWKSCCSVRENGFATLADEKFVEKVTADPAKFWREKAIPILADHGSIWERAKLADWLIDHPDILAADPGIFGNYFTRLVMLPGNRRTRLIRAWCNGRDVRPAKVAFYPDEYERSIANRAWVGHWLQGPFEADLVELATNDLKQPNGHCNVELAATLAHGAVSGGRGGWFRQQLRAQLDDQNLSGDARASWLIGLACVEEVLAGSPLRPQWALPYLTEAALVATSDEMKFRVVGQQVPRMLSLERFAEGRALLDQYDSRYTTAEQQAAIAQWRGDADQLEAGLDEHVAKRRAAFEHHRRANQLTTLQRRLERAEQRGDTALASRYRDMIRQVSPPQP